MFSKEQLMRTNEKIGALPFTDLLKQVVDEEEDETEVVSITQVSNAIKTLLDKTDRSFSTFY